MDIHNKHDGEKVNDGLQRPEEGEDTTETPEQAVDRICADLLGDDTVDQELLAVLTEHVVTTSPNSNAVPGATKAIVQLARQRAQDADAKDEEQADDTEADDEQSNND